MKAFGGLHGFRFGGAQPRSGGGGAGPVSDITQAEILGVTNLDPDGGAPSQGVNGNGWVLRVRTLAISAGGVPDPSKFTVTIRDPGYTTSGASIVSTTVTRTLTPLACIRRLANGTTMPTSTTDPQALAIQSGAVTAPGSLVAGTAVDWYLSLPELVYSGATSVTVSVAAGWYSTAAHGSGPTVTNSSTETYPNPIYGFVNLPQERVEASTMLNELWCNGHLFARNGRAVCGVELWARDGTNNGTASTVIATTLGTIQTRESIAEVFSASVSLTGVNDTDGTGTLGAGVQYIDGYIYPWIGTRYQISTDGVAWPTAQPCTVNPFVKDTAGKYGGAIAYVNPAGAGASPAVSRTAAANYAAAAVAAYATHAAARTAIVAFNAATAGRPASCITHSTLGGSEIRMLDNAGVAQTFELAGNIGEAAGNCWSITKNDAALNVAKCSYLQGGATAVRTVPTLTLFEMDLSKAGTAAIIGCGTGGNTQGNSLMICWRGGTVTLTAGTTTPYLRQAGLVYQYNINFNIAALGANVPGLGIESTSGLRCAKAIGITYSDVSSAIVPALTPYMLVGYTGRGILTDPSATVQTTPDGFIVDNCKLLKQASSNNWIGLWALTRGFYIGQSALVFTASQDFGPVAASSGTMLDVANGLIEHLTIPPDRADYTTDYARINYCYVDGAANRSRVPFVAMAYCISARMATKTDTFAFFNGGGVTGATGNFKVAYNVNSKGNSLAISRPPSFTASDFWRKVIDAKSQQNVGAFGFTDNQAGPTGTGAGTYTLTGTEVKNRVASGEARRSFDIAGAARKNDGTGAGGAYEY